MKPRTYQTEATGAAWKFICNLAGAALIVLPTGAGKSLIIGMLCRLAVKTGGRVLVIAHRKELLEQNAEKIEHMVGSPVGIYCAGLKRKDTDNQIIVASIQSLFRNPEVVGRRDLIIVDEAHLISPEDETMYAKVFRAYPKAARIGLTATPYRLGDGPIAGRGRQFRKICYEIKPQALVKGGYLSPITTKPTATVDTSSVTIRGGEFVPGELERAFDKPSLVDSACREMVSLTADRKSILVFCCGVDHAENVRAKLEELTGEVVGCVTGQTLPMERREMLHRFKSGTLRMMVNCEVLTTGFDSPRIDGLVLYRSTMSLSLFAQMVGRGFRIHPGKKDCLLLDYGGNRKRHGDPDSDEYGYAQAKEAVTSEELAAEKNSRGRICVNCEADIPPGELACLDCGFRPEIGKRGAPNHSDTADIEELKDWEVQAIVYTRHEKKKDPLAPPTLRATYTVTPLGTTGNLASETVSEWVCFQHSGFARTKAEQWWEKRSYHPIPETVDEALELINRHAIRPPSALETTRDGKWRRVSETVFVDPRPEPESLQETAAIPADGGWDDVPF